jgi:hypothetical protein
MANAAVAATDGIPGITPSEKRERSMQLVRLPAWLYDHCREPIQTAPLGFRRSVESPRTLEVDPATIGMAVSQRRRLGLSAN